jgi:linoleoyl-CoA desaturase
MRHRSDATEEPQEPKRWSSDEQRMASLCRELDAIHERVRAELGQEDLSHIEAMDRLSRRLTIAGRVLIHFGLDPLSFGAGVIALAAAHQLQAIEIGHSALHGAYDQLPGAERFHSTRFRWCGEIDEEAWRRAHNLLHHGHTNIAGRDPDLQVGLARWSAHVPYHPAHRLQIPIALTYTLFWWTGMSLHTIGVLDVYTRARSEMVIARDRSPRTIWNAHRRALRKMVPYKLKNYVVYPALAGPWFLKVMAGNWLADGLRDVYSALTIYSNHIGDAVATYPKQRRATSRGDWFRMQIEATNNFEVPHWMSVLCGGLDRHIEHHLFPRLPPNRLREIAPEVRAICERHGITYRTASWPATLARSFRVLASLARRPDRETRPDQR